MVKISVVSKIKGLLFIGGTGVKIQFGVTKIELSDKQLEKLKKVIKIGSLKKRIEKGDLTFDFSEIDEKKLKKAAKNLQENEIKEEAFKESYGYISTLSGLDLEEEYKDKLGKNSGNRGSEKMKDEIVSFLRKKEGL